MCTFEIVGEHVTLRQTTREDLDDLMRLWSDSRVMKWVGFPHGLGYDSVDMEEWFANVAANPTRHHFVIVAPEVGFCGETYYAIDSDYQRAGLDIKLITEAQGKGLATDALRTLIRHVFAVEDGVNSVWTQPSRENRAARRLYRRCGLRPAPRLPEITNGESFWALSRECAR